MSAEAQVLVPRVRWFEHLDSTSSELLRLAQEGEEEGLWLVAHQQSAGRGRCGRSWVSIPGNLHTSVLLRPPVSPARKVQVSLVAAVSLFDALVSLFPRLEEHLSFKWPNDLLCRGKKFAGILLESGENLGGYLIVGMGVNCMHAPDSVVFPATSLREEGVLVDSTLLFQSLLSHFHKVLQEWDLGSCFSKICDRWLQHADGLGKRMTVCCAKARVSGVWEGLDAQGNLLLRKDDGMIYRVVSGDVLFGTQGWQDFEKSAAV